MKEKPVTYLLSFLTGCNTFWLACIFKVPVYSTVITVGVSQVARAQRQLDNIKVSCPGRMKRFLAVAASGPRCCSGQVLLGCEAA